MISDIRRCFSGLENVWVDPDIPARKLRNARASHAIPDDETILCLYDDTLFGGGGDGVVLTAERLSTKAAFETARSVPYRAVEEVERDGDVVHVGGISVDFGVGWELPHAEALVSFLERVRDPRSRVRWSDRVLDAVRVNLGSGDDMYLLPAIPEHKIRNVREVHTLPDHEQVLALRDDTLFGSARDHWVFTDARLGWKNFLEEPGWLAWSDLPAAQLVEEPGAIRVGQASFSSEGTRAGLLPALQALVPHADREPRNPEIEAHILSDPTSDEGFLVYVDWLAERGHARGLFANARGAARVALGARHGLELGTDRPHDLMRLIWRHGFWDALVLFESGVPDDVEPIELVRRVLQHPSARFLRTLTVHGIARAQLDRILDEREHPTLVQSRARG